MTNKFLRTHPNLKANLPSLYMTPTTYKFRFPQDQYFDQYVAYASKNLEQFLSWQKNAFASFSSNSVFEKPTQHDLTTKANDTSTALPSKNFITKPIKHFLKTPSKFKFLKSLHHFLFILTTP